MSLEQTLLSKGVAGAAPKLGGLVIGSSPEDTVALGTRDPARYARCVARPGDGLSLPVRRDLGFHGYRLPPIRFRFAGVADDQSSDIRRRRHMLGMTDLDRVA